MYNFSQNHSPFVLKHFCIYVFNIQPVLSAHHLIFILFLSFFFYFFFSLLFIVFSSRSFARIPLLCKRNEMKINVCGWNYPCTQDKRQFYKYIYLIVVFFSFFLHIFFALTLQKKNYFKNAFQIRNCPLWCPCVCDISFLFF